MVGWVAHRRYSKTAMISSRSKLFSSSTDFWGIAPLNQDSRTERSRKAIFNSGARYSRLGAQEHRRWPWEFSMAWWSVGRKSFPIFCTSRN